MSEQLRERLMARSERSPSGCLLWQGKRNPGGYGHITIGSARDGTRRVGVGVHRVAFEAFVGPVPPGMCVLHTCDTPNCWESSHLFLGTDADNSADRDAKGRTGRAPGERNGQAALTDLRVMAVRWLAAEGLKHGQIAELTGVRRAHITRLCQGTRWRHLPVLPYVSHRGTKGGRRGRRND